MAFEKAVLNQVAMNEREEKKKPCSFLKHQ